MRANALGIVVAASLCVLRAAAQEFNEQQLPAGVKARLAVLAGNRAGSGGAEAIRTLLEAAIAREGRFDVVERRALENVLDELELSESLGDPQSRLQLGRVIPAQYVVVVESTRAANGSYEVFTRLVNVETTEIIGTHNQSRGADPALSGSGAVAREIAQWLKETLPVRYGKVDSVREDRLYVSWDSDGPAPKGAHVVVLAVEAPWVDTQTGNVIEEGKAAMVAYGRIESTTDNLSTVRIVILEGGRRPKIEPGMAVRIQ